MGGRTQFPNFSVKNHQRACSKMIGSVPEWWIIGDSNGWCWIVMDDDDDDDDDDGDGDDDDDDDDDDVLPYLRSMTC